MTTTPNPIADHLRACRRCGGAHARGDRNSRGRPPTPPPSPGYQIAGPDGPEFPGLQVYPRVCGRSARRLQLPLRPRHLDLATPERSQ